MYTTSHRITSTALSHRNCHDISTAAVTWNPPQLLLIFLYLSLFILIRTYIIFIVILLRVSVRVKTSWENKNIKPGESKCHRGRFPREGSTSDRRRRRVCGGEKYIIRATGGRIYNTTILFYIRAAVNWGAKPKLTGGK